MRAKKRDTRTLKTLENYHRSWKRPWDSGNSPDKYLKRRGKSQFLLKFIKKYSNLKSNILEIGCNVGRNLNCLFTAGFKNLTGIEISKHATELMKTAYPNMAAKARIYNASVESIIKKFRKNRFDIIFTMAVLEHIHPDSAWVFAEIARITGKYLIVIEAEKADSWRIVSRNYKQVFETLGLKQICSQNCGNVPSLKSYTLRIFASSTGKPCR